MTTCDAGQDQCPKLKRFCRYVSAKRSDMEDRDDFSDEWSEVSDFDEDL